MKRAKYQRQFLFLHYLVFVVASLISLACQAKDDFAREISAIESLLAKNEFEEAKKFASDTAARDAHFIEAQAFLSLIIGEPRQTLFLLNSASQDVCASLSINRINLSAAQDYLFDHCGVHWSLRLRAHFALHDWPKVVESIETIQQVNKPNPIYSELVLYALTRKISNLQSSKLDILLSEVITKNPQVVAVQLALAIINDQETQQVKPKNVNELSLAAAVANISKTLITKKAYGYEQALDFLKTKVPARFDGANMEIGLLRSLAKSSSTQK